MKNMKKAVIILFLSLMHASITLAQDAKGWSLIPKAGVTNGHWVGDAVAYESNRMGWTIGVDAEERVSRLFSMTYGLQYTRTGSIDKINTSRVGGENFPYMTSVNKERKMLDYIQLPILANLHLAKGLTLKAGVQFGFLTRAKLKQHVKGFFDPYDNIGTNYTNNNNGTRREFDEDQTSGILSEFNKVDLCFPVGLSYEFKNIALDARYHFGVANIKRIDSCNTYNRYLSVTLGYKFDL